MDKKDILEAAHTVWSSFWAAAVGEKGGSLPPGANESALAPRLDERKLLPVFNACLHKMDEAVKAVVGDRSRRSMTESKDTHEVEMDDHIPAEDHERYLWRVVMACLGSGISPTDDGEEMPDYLECPCTLDDSPWHELAFDSENLGQPNEAYVKKGGLKCPVCGSVPQADSPDVGGTVVTVNCWCEQCKSRWTDEYVLTGYSGLDFYTVHK